jgi:hypothetical protein
LRMSSLRATTRNPGNHGSRIKSGMTATGNVIAGYDPQSRKSWIPDQVRDERGVVIAGLTHYCPEKSSHLGSK